MLLNSKVLNFLYGGKKGRSVLVTIYPSPLLLLSPLILSISFPTVPPFPPPYLFPAMPLEHPTHLLSLPTVLLVQYSVTTKKLSETV